MEENENKSGKEKKKNKQTANGRKLKREKKSCSGKVQILIVWFLRENQIWRTDAIFSFSFFLTVI